MLVPVTERLRASDGEQELGLSTPTASLTTDITNGSQHAFPPSPAGPQRYAKQCSRQPLEIDGIKSVDRAYSIYLG